MAGSSEDEEEGEEEALLAMLKLLLLGVERMDCMTTDPRPQSVQDPKECMEEAAH